VAQSEILLGSFLVEWLFPRYKDGVLRLQAKDLYPYLRELPKRRLIKHPWKETTLRRVASALLRMSTDFGLTQGRGMLAFVPYRLPDESFLYVLHAMAELQPNAGEMIQSPQWRIFLLDPDAVEREIYRLHQYRKLRYEAAGSIRSLELPSVSAEAYALELVA